MLQDAATTLRKSIELRKEEALRLGENTDKGPRRRHRIGEEERLLRQIEKVLQDRKNDQTTWRCTD